METIKTKLYLYMNNKYLIFHIIPQDIITQETRALVLSLGVCYHAALKDKKSYREYIAEEFEEPCALNSGANQFLREITR